MAEMKCENYNVEAHSYMDAQRYPNLYHYTSMNAFYSMMFETHEFWFSSAKHLNDRNELIDFIEKLEKATSEKIVQGKALQHASFFSEIRSLLPSRYPWILCFSDRRDDASQWERYADGAKGVCIKFNTQNFSKILRHISGACYLQRVNYKYDVAAHAYFKNVVDLINNNSLNGFSSTDALMENILATAAAYKHQSFEAENEIRGIILLSLENNQEYIYLNSVVKSIVKINYITLCNRAGVEVSDLFDEIIIGPRSQQDIDLLKEFFKAKGCAALAEIIVKSECPLR